MEAGARALSDLLSGPLHSDERRLGQGAPALPQGLRTPLARDGAPLSPPQTVALTVARALASQPSVLILDRSLDRIGSVEAARLADLLFSERNGAMMVVSSDPAIRARMDSQVDLSEPNLSRGEAA